MKIKLISIMLLFSLLVACSKDGYRIEGDKVVYEVPWNTGSFTVIHDLDADPNTFEILGDDNLTWAKDDHKVYMRYKELTYMDSESFEVINISFAKDKDKVICGRDIIKETNPEDFKLRTYVTRTGYTDYYGTDRNAAYLCSRVPNGYVRIPSNFIDSFQQLEDGFYKDKETVSWSGLILPDVNVSTFKVLSGGYATDGKVVYYHWRPIIDADLPTFQILDDDKAQDKNHKYKFEYIADSKSD